MASTSDRKFSAPGVPSNEAQSPPSDNDSGERPVRKQLKETTIESAPGDNNPDTHAEKGHSRKRSFEKSRDDTENPNENSDGSRKRSRESSPEDTVIVQPTTENSTNDSGLHHNVSPLDTPSNFDVPKRYLIAGDHLDGSNAPPRNNPCKPESSRSEPDSETSQDLWSIPQWPGYEPWDYVPEHPTIPTIQTPNGPAEIIIISDDEEVPPTVKHEVIVISDDEEVASHKPKEEKPRDDFASSYESEGDYLKQEEPGDDFIPFYELEGDYRKQEEPDDDFDSSYESEGEHRKREEPGNGFIPSYESEGAQREREEPGNGFVPFYELEGDYVKQEEPGDDFIPSYESEGAQREREEPGDGFAPFYELEGDYVKQEEPGDDFIPFYELEGDYLKQEEPGDDFIPSIESEEEQPSYESEGAQREREEPGDGFIPFYELEGDYVKQEEPDDDFIPSIESDGEQLSYESEEEQPSYESEGEQSSYESEGEQSSYESEGEQSSYESEGEQREREEPDDDFDSSYESEGEQREQEEPHDDSGSPSKPKGEKPEQKKLRQYHRDPLTHVHSYTYISSDEEERGYFCSRHGVRIADPLELVEDKSEEDSSEGNTLPAVEVPDQKCEEDWDWVSHNDAGVPGSTQISQPQDHPQEPQDNHQEPQNPDTQSEKNDDTNQQLQDATNPTTEDAPSRAESDASKAPKKKRSREELDEGTKKSDAPQVPSQTMDTEGKMTEGEPEKKRHRDNSQERDAKTADAFASSAFANTSASSPFASIGKKLTGKNDTVSTSSFATSSMAAFAGSEKSPFGALGATSSSSVFKPTTSGTTSFESTVGSPGFGAMGSGFSGVGGGFTVAAKPSGLTSFAAPIAPTSFQAKPIGAEESEADESNCDEENDTFEAEKTDDRFFEQTIETGEEEEETIFSCKAKLFHFNKEWKERGIGTFKLNVRKNADGKQIGRMIMRADGAGRVMLNSLIFKGMNYGDAKNEPPKSKQILLASTEEGHTVPLLLRTGNEAYATELYETIGDLLKEV